jgi:hypothetical protein
MLSKVFEGHSFYFACRYVCNKNGSELLDALGVRGYDFKLMAEDFLRQSGLRPSKTQACFHSVLSFYPGEDPGDDKMMQIAKEYLEKLGIINTQFAIIKHTDKAHLHLHVLANMVNNDGKSIKDNWIGLRGKKAAQQLTRKYQLIPAEGKNLKLTHLEALSQSEADKYNIYQAISENLPFCHTMADLEARLLALGIKTQYKYKGKTTGIQGVSFKIGNSSFKGSQVDRQYSFGGLQKLLALQLKQKLLQHPTPDLTVENSTLGNWSKRPIHKKAGHSSEEKGKNPGPEFGQLLGKVFDILMKPDADGGYVPYELTPEGYRRKRKKKPPHH